VLVDADRRPVPVQHRPLHASAPPPQRDAGQRPQQRPSASAAALGGEHEEILEIERGARQERRVREEVEREADGPAAATTDEGLEIAPPAEAVTPDPAGRGDALVGQALVLGQAPDQREDRRNVAPGARADRQTGGGHDACQAAATASSISV
jgi:hypothetical protein